MRDRVNFETINKCKYEVINPNLIEQSRIRIRKSMRKYLSKFFIMGI